MLGRRRSPTARRRRPPAPRCTTTAARSTRWATAIAAVTGRRPFEAIEARLRRRRGRAGRRRPTSCAIAGERIEDDPERLAAVRERRQLLHDLRRKYGETLADVHRVTATRPRARLAELERYETRAAALDARASGGRSSGRGRGGGGRRGPSRPRADAGDGRRATSSWSWRWPRPASRSRSATHDPGDDVAFLLAANPGAPLLPLGKVASGGELARAMLALRLVLLERRDDSGPPTLVFDEVDAGIGGQAAVAVGRALATLGDDHQVLVVTHLPQVAAFADTQVAVTKTSARGATIGHRGASSTTSDRVVELSRMLSGSPTARPPASTPRSCSSQPAALTGGDHPAGVAGAPSRDMPESPVTKHIFVTGGVASSLGQGPHRLLARAGCSRPGACGSRCRSSTRTSTSTPAR